MKQLTIIALLFVNPLSSYSHHTEDPKDIIWRNARDVFHGDTTGMTIEVGQHCAVKIYPRKGEDTKPIEDKIVRACQALRQRSKAREENALSKASLAVSGLSLASMGIGSLYYPAILKASAIAGTMYVPPIMLHSFFKYIYKDYRGNGWLLFGVGALSWGLTLGTIALIGFANAGILFSSILALAGFIGAKRFKSNSIKSEVVASKLQKEADSIVIPWSQN